MLIWLDYFRDSLTALLLHPWNDTMGAPKTPWAELTPPTQHPAEGGVMEPDSCFLSADPVTATAPNATSTEQGSHHLAWSIQC